MRPSAELEWKPRLGRRGRPGARPCLWKSGGGVRRAERPPLAASALQSDPAPMLPGRTWARTPAGCDVRAQVPITPNGRPRGDRGWVPLNRTLSLGDPAVTPLQAPHSASGVHMTLPPRASDRRGPYLPSWRKGPVHVKQAEDALLPAGALRGHSHGCSSACPPESRDAAARAAQGRGQMGRGPGGAELGETASVGRPGCATRGGRVRGVVSAGGGGSGRSVGGAWADLLVRMILIVPGGEGAWSRAEQSPARRVGLSQPMRRRGRGRAGNEG